MRDNCAGEPSGPLAAVQRRVRSWAIAALDLSPVVLSVSTVVLFGLAVVIVARLVTIYEGAGSGAAPVLTPALTSTPAPAVPRAPIAEAPPGPTPAPPVVAAPGPELTVPTPKTHPAPAKPPEQGPGGNLAAVPAAPERADRGRDTDKVRAEAIQSGERAVTAPQAASGVEQRGQQRARSEKGMERSVGRSVCGRWGIPQDRCDDAIDDYRADY